MGEGKTGKAKGAIILAESLTPEQRKAKASKAATVRWERRRNKLVSVGANKLPTAVYKGVLDLMGADIPCYVLDTGQRVIGRTAYTEALTGIKGGGDLEKYLGVSSLKSFISMDMVLEGMVAFSLPEVEGLDRDVKGLPADLAIEIWRGFVNAIEASLVSPESVKLTARQTQMAMKASALLGACAKVGLDALIDEATGAQYDRATDALRVKLKAYLEDEMRKWEKTFPDELWVEFARLTKWKGTVTQRPKYWGKLVMELVYEYLDKDVAIWLKENAPTPKHGQNYHQWLSGQYGLKKLVEHLWVLVGIARTCQSMVELRQKMAELNGKRLVQFMLPIPNDPIQVK
jgi:P63C domain